MCAEVCVCFNWILPLDRRTFCQLLQIWCLVLRNNKFKNYKAKTITVQKT